MLYVSLAKVGVVSSNLIARSSFLKNISNLRMGLRNERRPFEFRGSKGEALYRILAGRRHRTGRASKAATAENSSLCLVHVVEVIDTEMQPAIRCDALGV